MTDSPPDAVRWHLAVARFRAGLAELADELGLLIEPIQYGSHRVAFEVAIDRDDYEIDDTELTDAIVEMLEFEDDSISVPPAPPVPDPPEPVPPLDVDPDPGPDIDPAPGPHYHQSRTDTAGDDLGDGHTGDDDDGAYPYEQMRVGTSEPDRDALDSIRGFVASHDSSGSDVRGDTSVEDDDTSELEQDNLALVHELNQATRFETLSERAVEALEDLPEGQTASWFATNDIDFEGSTAEEIFDELCEVRTRVGPHGVEYVDGYEPPAARTDGDDDRSAPSSAVSHNETDDDSDDLAVDPPAMDSTVHR